MNENNDFWLEVCYQPDNTEAKEKAAASLTLELSKKLADLPTGSYLLRIGETSKYSAMLGCNITTKVVILRCCNVVYKNV